MGYLPIILAMAGFIILWGIVSSNSIKNRKKEAEASASLLFEQLFVRNRQLRQLDHLKALPPAVQRFLNLAQDQHESAVSSTDILLAAQKVSTDTAMPDFSVPDVDNQACREAYEQLQVAQGNLQNVARLFKIKLKQYNELTGKYPTKLIARLTGHYPISRQ